LHFLLIRVPYNYSAVRKIQFVVARHEEHLQGATRVAPAFLAKTGVSKKYIFQLSHWLVEYSWGK